MSDDRLARLERSNRILTLVTGALCVLSAASLLRSGSPGSAPLPSFLPAAHAQSIQTYAPDAVHPDYVLTTSQSGSTLYEWVYDAKQKVWIKRTF